MKLTKTKLKRIIREEIQSFRELEVLPEAAPKMRAKPGQKELKSITRQLEMLKSIDISGKHVAKLKSAITSAQKSIGKIESIIRMSSTV